MATFIVRRILLTIPVLLGLLLLVFFLSRVLPGSQCYALLGERATIQQCADFDHKQGFDQPIRRLQHLRRQPFTTPDLDEPHVLADQPLPGGRRGRVSRSLQSHGCRSSSVGRATHS